MDDRVISSPQSPLLAYQMRVLPWGETCKAAESRLKAIRLREKWLKRSFALRKDERIDLYEAYYRMHLEFAPDKTEAILAEIELTDEDERFLEYCRAALQSSYPLRAGIERELDWIGGNLNKPIPNVDSAPSLWALNFIMDARVNPDIRKNFWATCWSKRLSPGDKKPKATALKSDAVETEAEWGDQHLEDLKKRMKGG